VANAAGNVVVHENAFTNLKTLDFFADLRNLSNDLAT
jgi:hypothetical protein